MRGTSQLIRPEEERDWAVVYALNVAAFKAKEPLFPCTSADHLLNSWSFLFKRRGSIVAQGIGSSQVPHIPSLTSKQRTTSATSSTVA
jgi:hypothetical protein